MLPKVTFNAALTNTHAANLHLTHGVPMITGFISRHGYRVRISVRLFSTDRYLNRSRRRSRVEPERQRRCEQCASRVPGAPNTFGGTLFSGPYGRSSTLVHHEPAEFDVSLDQECQDRLRR